MLDTLHQAIKIMKMTKKESSYTTDMLMNKNCLNMNLELVTDMVANQEGFTALIKFDTISPKIM